MRRSNLPATGENLFQGIKKMCAEAQAANPNLKLIKLSIGQPSGPALEPARIAASKAILSSEESMHEYQDNDSPGVPNFARRFIQRHVKRNLAELSADQIDYLPIPGIKPMLGVVIQAMGSWAYQTSLCVSVGTMTNPGYPTPADQCQIQKYVFHHSLCMPQERGFMPDLDDITETYGEGDLLMLNFPHNPTGIVATEEYLREFCGICQEERIWIFSDEAYQILNYSKDGVSLADIAPDYPDLNWAAAFSASKAGNFTGWRIGAMIGSPEFIGDIKRIKGNSDSGFAAPLAAGILDLFENHFELIEEVKNMYRTRLNMLVGILSAEGMRISVLPQAGFFVLCDTPSLAFGQKIEDATKFNNLMISETGIVGVPFGKWIRYAVCATDIIAMGDQIRDAFAKAAVSY